LPEHARIPFKRLSSSPFLFMYDTEHKGWLVGSILSLAGVLVGGIGGFVLATTYDHENPTERPIGLAIGVVLMAIGVGLFTVGWWV
jgi:hypothetical protein